MSIYIGGDHTYVNIYMYVFMLIHTYRKYVDGLGPWHDCFRSFSTFWRFRDLGFIQTGVAKLSRGKSFPIAAFSWTVDGGWCPAPVEGLVQLLGCCIP